MTGLLPPNWRSLPLLGPHASPGGMLYRAAALSHATAEELAQCPADLTWIDLRTQGEVDEETRHHVPSAWSHVHVPFMEMDVEVGQASDALRDLIEGVTTFGDHYCVMLETAAPNIAEVLRVLADTAGPVVIACQGGRDRTGIISAILLLLAGAERQTVIEDYTRTNVDLQENLARQPGGQLAQELFARLNLLCRPEDITMATDYIAERGGVRAYLGEHITDADYDRVVRVVRTRLGLGSPSSLVPRPQQLHTQKEPARD